MDNQAQPLLHWVLLRFPDTPKARAKQWIETGRVSVGTVVIRKPHQLVADPGDSLQLVRREAVTLSFGRGWRIHPRVTLLFLDSCLAIVDKGPGLLSVTDATGNLSAQSILADFLAGNLKPRDPNLSAKNLPPAYRKLHPLPVHRLDQYTSGVFCLAMNPKARAHLIEQLKIHTMRREYIAFVEGRPNAAKGTWRNWVKLSDDGLRQQIVTRSKTFLSEQGWGISTTRDPGKRATTGKIMGAESGTSEAVTHFEVLDEYMLPASAGDVSKLRLRLETGRKHQIRIQAAHAGLPLIGDRTYNARYRDGSGAAVFIDRQALHSELLTLEHPERPGQHMTWRAELPKDLQQLEARLRSSKV
jgi:23S rRNA pseudouridine1911/1915/1917 synthase